MTNLTEMVTNAIGTLQSSADKAKSIVETDAVIQTEAGERNSLPKVIREAEVEFANRLAGMAVSNIGTFTAGAILIDSRQTLTWELAAGGDGHEYGWTGNFPTTGLTVPAGSVPQPIGRGGWVDLSGEVVRVREDLEKNGHTVDQISMQTAIHHSGRAGYAALPRLIRSFINYDDAAAPVIKVLGLGSSVGNGASLPDPANQAPVMYLTKQLNAKFNKLGNKTITGYNRSVNGSTLTDGVSALANALAEPLAPKLTVLVFGMNDGGTAIYNAGQTYPWVYTRAVEIIEKAKAAKSDVIVLTSPHPHSQRVSWAMPPGIAQIYPTAVSADVPNESLIPPVSKSSPIVDAAGNGVKIPVSYRHFRVNESLRRAAADCGVPVIDAEWYWFKAVGDLGEDALFNPGEILHPNLIGHQLSYWLAIDDFIDSLTASVISGNHQSDFQQRAVTGLSADQSPLARNHLRQSSSNTSESVARFDTSDGLAGMVVDKAGNVVPINTSNAEWVTPGLTIQKRQYGSTSNYHTIERSVIGDFNRATALNVPIKNGASFELTVKAEQSGIGFQHIKVHGYNSAGVITLAQDWTQGSAVTTITASGANVVITPAAANTNMMYKLDVMTL